MGLGADRLLGLRVRIPAGALMSVSSVCCQMEVSATGWSLVQRNPAECGLSVSVMVEPRHCGIPDPLGAVEPRVQGEIHV